MVCGNNSESRMTASDVVTSKCEKVHCHAREVLPLRGSSAFLPLLITIGILLKRNTQQEAYHESPRNLWDRALNSQPDGCAFGPEWVRRPLSIRSPPTLVQSNAPILL